MRLPIQFKLKKSKNVHDLYPCLPQENVYHIVMRFLCTSLSIFYQHHLLLRLSDILWDIQDGTASLKHYGFCESRYSCIYSTPQQAAGNMTLKEI